MKLLFASICISTVLAFLGWNYVALPYNRDWTAEEIALIQSLSLQQLPTLASDPSNRVADSELAAEFGRHLFFDTRLSGNGAVACATCHQPDLMFTDGLSLAVGTSAGSRHTPSLVGVAYSPWFYWDGRKDSQWAQALAPLETSHEHNSTRIELSRLIATDSRYRSSYESLFGALPAAITLTGSASPLGNIEQRAAWQAMTADDKARVSVIFANLGKALAAYQRKLIPGITRFDEYANALTDQATENTSDQLNPSEIAGLRLFIGKAQCISCHNGPLLTNHEFHNTGVLSTAGQLPGMGRYDGIRLARQDPFNCLGAFSDAAAAMCTELRFARDGNDLVGAHKTPSLRNVTITAPYMHGGQIATLREVIEHYNNAPTSMLNHNEAKPLQLRPVERRQLTAFLQTLSAPLASAEKWLQAPSSD